MVVLLDPRRRINQVIKLTVNDIKTDLKQIRDLTTYDFKLTKDDIFGASLIYFKDDNFTKIFKTKYNEENTYKLINTLNSSDDKPMFSEK